MGLAAEFAGRGIDAELSIPEPRRLPRGSGHGFEEKLIPPMTGFSHLCTAELRAGDAEVFDWGLLVPVDFEGMIELPVESSYSCTTTVRSAQRMLPVARRLAEALELPADLPLHCDNLQLTEFFMDREEDGPTSATPTGRWAEDIGIAFYVALYLRAAEYSLRCNCPLFFS